MNEYIQSSELSQNKQNTLYRKSQSHSFDVQNAEMYGIECAILINHFQFWIEQNQAMGRNFHDGRTWMYQTQKEIACVYPYWSEDTVFRTIKKLLDEEILIKGNYNKTNFDKTTWYAFKNEEMFTKPRNRGIDGAKSRNRLRDSAEPIPDTNPNPKQEVLSVVASPPEKDLVLSDQKEKEPTESKISQDPLQKIKISTANQKEIVIDPNDVFYRANKERKDWSLSEIREAWTALSSSQKIIYDWWRFIEGTIKNIRQKQKSINITKGVNTCKTKQEKNTWNEESEKPSEKCLQKHPSGASNLLEYINMCKNGLITQEGLS